MHRIEGVSADRSTGINLFKTSPPYTVVSPEWMNSIQEELMNVIVQAGLPVQSQYEDTKDQLWKAINRNSITYIDNVNYTVLDTDKYIVFIFKNLTADRTFYLPTLRDNIGKKFIIYNLTGTYKVIVTPEGTDLINDWNTTFEITEKGGRLECLALSTHWECTPNENCCIYSVSSETTDSGLTLDGTWDDVDGMVITIPSGKFNLDAFGNHRVNDTSIPQSLELQAGLGTISGNNAPNIQNNRLSYINTIANSVSELAAEFHIHNFQYISSNVSIYMKARANSNESPVTSHYMYGEAGVKMYVNARRLR